MWADLERAARPGQTRTTIFVIIVTHPKSGGRIQKKFRRGFWERGAEDESPQATRPRRRTRRGGGELGGGVPLPSRLWGLGERRDLPQRENGFGALYSCQKAPRSNHFEFFEVLVFH